MRKGYRRERLAGARQLVRELRELQGYWFERQEAIDEPVDNEAWTRFRAAANLRGDTGEVSAWMAAREAKGQSTGLAEWGDHCDHCDRGRVQAAISKMRAELTKLGIDPDAVGPDPTDPATAVMGKALDIETVNRELAVLAEDAWEPEWEGRGDTVREAIARWRVERNALERELDALVADID